MGFIFFIYIKKKVTIMKYRVNLSKTSKRKNFMRCNNSRMKNEGKHDVKSNERKKEE